VKHDLEPYYCHPSHWPSEKWGEYKRIVWSFRLFDISSNDQAEILECLHDEISWDWYADCDGCTCVSEPGWPSKYFPPCVRHDYDWHRGAGGWESNARFRRLNLAYHMEGWRANARWIGVTAAWYSWFKWRDLIFGAPSSR
jgi:hypothetical protein